MPANGLMLRDSAYEHIRRRITTGEYAMGSRISEQAIAEEIGISRTPVRSAIRQLEIEGLLEQIPRYGTIVKSMKRQDLDELYDCRIALESYACESAARKITPHDLSELKALCTTMQTAIGRNLSEGGRADAALVKRSVEDDIQFHIIILRSTGNARLMRSAVDSRLLADWGRCAWSLTDMRVIEKTWEQHAQVLSALERGDREQSRQAMISHLEFAKQNALTMYDRAMVEAQANEVMQRMNRDASGERSARPA